MSDYTYSDELYSDLHKDALGFRPAEAAWRRWQAMAPDEKQAHWVCLQTTMAENETQRVRDEAENLIVIEKTIAERMTGGKTRQDVVAELMVEHDANNDPDFLCWKLGVPYGSFSEPKAEASAARLRAITP